MKNQLSPLNATKPIFQQTQYKFSINFPKCEENNKNLRKK